MQEKWNQFVYYLCEDKKSNVDEPKYHNRIEAQLELLGWMKFKNEICHKLNVPIGNGRHIQPDILVQKDGKNQFVIEVKCPGHTQIAKDCDQLVSYMRQLKLKAGIYIGEHIEIFYDQPDSENAISILKIPLELDNKRGTKFVELFSKDRFSKESIVQFCEARIKEMQHEESLNKIKEHLIGDAQKQITDGMKMFLLEKYGNTFTENDIVGMLASLKFSATPLDNQQTINDHIPIPIVPQKQVSKTINSKHKHDSTLYSINGSKPLNKRRFVHQLVKLYVEQHPKTSFAKLEEVFPATLQGSYGVIRSIDYIRKKGYEGSRYLMKDDELLRSSDGIVFAVCSQWGKANITKYIDLAKKLGYTITTPVETPTQKGSIENKTIECFLTRNANAKGYFNLIDQSLTVLKGSQINPGYLAKVNPKTKEKREVQIAEFSKRKGDLLVVTKDVVFKTPSGASQFCVGGSSNGWRDWRDINNNELDIYRNKKE